MTSKAEWREAFGIWHLMNDNACVAVIVPFEGADEPWYYRVHVAYVTNGRNELRKRFQSMCEGLEFTYPSEEEAKAKALAAWNTPLIQR